jgi:hypothetical protein
MLTLDNGQLSARDLGSASGTRVNGRLITEPTLLCVGDILSMGGCDFVVSSGSAVADTRRPGDSVTRKDLPQYTPDFPEDPESETQEQTPTVQLLESMLKNAPGAQGDHFGRVRGAIDRYLAQLKLTASATGDDVSRLRVCIEATRALDGSANAGRWRAWALGELDASLRTVDY